MLYNNFIVCIMTCALFAMINMIYDQEWKYILLPIGILIWGIFKFFNDNDRNYLKSKGIDPDSYDCSLFSDFYDGGYSNRNNTNKYNRKNTWGNDRFEDNFDSNLFGANYEYSRYLPKKLANYQDPRYKGMVKKCKRNFKISIEKEKNESEQSKSLFYSLRGSGK